MAKRRKTTKRSYDQKSSNKSDAITPVEYGGLQHAFDHLNAALFETALPDCLLTLQRKANSGGHFAPDRFSERGGSERRHEVNLNPNGFVGRSDEFIVSILLHEMVHLWQHVLGKDPPKRRNYHNTEWSRQMQRCGLMPSSTGMVGGKTTGAHMGHYIIDDGPFRQAFAELAASGWRLNLESAQQPREARRPSSKTKFTCPSCGWKVWGKPDTGVFCKPCWLATGGRLIELRADNVATVPAVESYEQQAA